MHYKSAKKIHIIIIFLFLSTLAFPQVEKKRKILDTLVVDTLLAAPDYKISKDAVEFPIIYNATDTMIIDNKTQKVYLVNNASAVYGTIDLKSYYIELDLVSSDVYAYGRRDSSGKLVDTPIFKDGDEEFNCEELRYNFKSKKARILNIITEQEGGFLHSDITKMHEDGNLHIRGSKYTTCDAEHPHFYVRLPKAKVYPGEKIISGPAYLVLEDIPLPIALPFGYFPVQQEVSSGIIIPRYGEERGRGYFLKDGGYYFNINDYFDLKFTGDLYTNGTWRMASASNYRMRYKFSGNFSFSYANNVTGHKNLEDYSKSTNYSIRWTHTQDPKARPGSRFSASVNMSSSGYDRENSYTVAEHVTTTKQSSISYSKSWAGTPFNFSTSLNHSQNSSTKNVSVNLPKASFSMGRIYPLKSKNSTKKGFWQDLQIQYSASLDNRINVADSLLFTDQVWQNMKNGFKHDIPITLPIRFIKNFTVSPQLRYSGVLYTSKVEKRWEDNYYDPVTNDTISGVITEEIPGFFYGQSFSPSISASYSPQIFGTYTFKNPDSRIIAVRHVLKPSVSFSYVPSMDGWSSDMYREYVRDTLGNMGEYSIFEGSIYGTPSLPSRSGSVSFSLTNIFEAKVRTRNDTTGLGEKVKLIDNLALSTSYNPFLDSLRWAPVSLTFRTRLMKEIDISARGAFDMYANNESGGRINKFLWETDRKPARLTNFNLSVGFDLKRLIDNYLAVDNAGNEQDSQSDTNMGLSFDKESRDPARETKPAPSGLGVQNSDAGGLVFDEYGYADFSVPWSLRLAYNMYYRTSGLTSDITQNMTLNGSVTLTNKWAISYTTGYDFKMKDITMTRIGIERDLHCWQMSFNWVPAGYLKSWDFTIRVKSSVLQDLKYERRKDFHDNSR